MSEGAPRLFGDSLGGPLEFGVFREYMIKLKKPPLIEVWVRFDVGYGERELPFNPSDFRNAAKIAGDFINEFKGRFDLKRTLNQSTVELKPRPNDNPDVSVSHAFAKVMACDSSESWWLQVGPSYLAVNALRTKKDQDYPGFSKVRETALKCLARYIDYFQPEQLPCLTVHYVDVVEIPLEPAVDLKDYFLLYPHFPESGFGPSSGLQMNVTTSVPSGAELRVSLRRESDDAHFRRFRLEWNLCSRKGCSLDLSEIDRELVRLNEQMQACFRACFTDRCWKLFEPMEE